MKKTILIVLTIISITSCTTVNKYSPSTTGEYYNNPDGYTLLESKRTKSVSQQVFFLFIPFGGKSESTMQAECYDAVLKETSADGIFLPTFIETRKRYPFYCKTVTELSGRPYKIRLK